MSSVQVTTEDKFSRIIQDRISRLEEKVMDALNTSGEMVVKTATEDYLSGPRPGTLDRITGNLAGSLTVTPKDNETAVTVGTNVEYAAIHELGGVISDGFGVGTTIIMPPRPYLRPALEDNRDKIRQLVKAAVIGAMK